jgi:hypothetical protein
MARALQTSKHTDPQLVRPNGGAGGGPLFAWPHTQQRVITGLTKPELEPVMTPCCVCTLQRPVSLPPAPRSTVCRCCVQAFVPAWRQPVMQSAPAPSTTDPPLRPGGRLLVCKGLQQLGECGVERPHLLRAARHLNRRLAQVECQLVC